MQGGFGVGGMGSPMPQSSFNMQHASFPGMSFPAPPPPEMMAGTNYAGPYPWKQGVCECTQSIDICKTTTTI